MIGSIEVERVSKRFAIDGGRVTDLREKFSPRFRHRGDTAPRSEFWALRDVSFSVAPGESLGIVGHNGSGKSTLLKMLTGILKPTNGSVRTQGRVSALIEVGAGFHPDLTGRENVFLNGSILGIPRRVIAQKFDEIVDFSGLERFIDTPVKRYSSGMYMRLGFAIASHVDPDILLIDEVLAVGDQLFQNKCLRKMKEFLAGGGTVIFVSHAMQLVAQLCERCVWLDHGQMLYDGRTDETVERYMEMVTEREEEAFKRDHPTEWAEREEERRREEEHLRAEAERQRAREEAEAVLRAAAVEASLPPPRPRPPSLREWKHDAPGNAVVRLHSVRVRSEEGRTVEAIDIRHPVGIEMVFDVLEPGHVLAPNFHVYTAEDTCAFIVCENDPAWQRSPRPVGRTTSTAWIPGNFLAPGTLTVGAAISTLATARIHADAPEAIAFQVIDSFEGDAARGDYAGPIPGVVRPALHWTTRTEPPAAVAP